VCEHLAEKQHRKASEEHWELTEIKWMEKQATEEKAVKEHMEKAHAEAAQKAMEEKAAKEWAEVAQKAMEAKKVEGSKKGKGPMEASRTPVKVSIPPIALFLPTDDS
jgi:septal ring factor EnvC (AmiA/AmiB activator)